MKTIGSRAEVWHGAALRTSGGLKKENLKMVKDRTGLGRLKSKRKSNYMLKNPGKNPLKKYLRPKGSKGFGPVNDEMKYKTNNKSNKSNKSNNKTSKKNGKKQWNIRSLFKSFLV